MRIFFVLCALLTIAVTSLARPTDVENANEKTTTAVPLITKSKNDSLNTTPASVVKSDEKLASTAAYTTPSITTADKPKDPAKPYIDPSKTVTSNPKDDSTSVVTVIEKATTTVKPTATTATITTTTIATTTNAVPSTTSSDSNITTALPTTTVCPPLPGRHFDGLSFLGGIILTICLIGVGVFLCKYCQNIHEDKYRTL
ncbi:hypothetical protein KPH14_001192 [Odynerus spinipes]|uniref:Uncharacterized protein n=1 Tax=Odynerus spinipes TaxID=1348599 RepID=A0AAD9RQT5_9HYME|nr:hypothetical protein KPH14_001192 [Odynerus spinipes]